MSVVATRSIDVLVAVKETALREVIEGSANPVAVFLPNFPINKQQLDAVTSEVNIRYSLITN